MNRAIAALRRYGYRLTPQRRAVLEVIVDAEQHLTPADIHRRVQNEHSGVGLVTVYRTIEVLARLGLICEVRMEDGGRSYLLTRPLGDHHHLICSHCGRVVDFTGSELDDLERRLSQETGFKINDHLLQFTGYCPFCQGAC